MVNVAKLENFGSSYIFMGNGTFDRITGWTGFYPVDLLGRESDV